MWTRIKDFTFQLGSNQGIDSAYFSKGRIKFYLHWA